MEFAGEASTGEAGGRAGPAGAPGRAADGCPDAGARRHRGDPARITADPRASGVRVLVLTTLRYRPVRVRGAARPGASGVSCLKDVTPDELLAANPDRGRRGRRCSPRRRPATWWPTSSPGRPWAGRTRGWRGRAHRAGTREVLRAGPRQGAVPHARDRPAGWWSRPGHRQDPRPAGSLAKLGPAGPGPAGHRRVRVRVDHPPAADRSLPSAYIPRCIRYAAAVRDKCVLAGRRGARPRPPNVRKRPPHSRHLQGGNCHEPPSPSRR